MNTDGAQVFRSSSHTLWPVFFVINELPPALRYTIVIHVLALLYLTVCICVCDIRFTRKYTLLGGLWCAKDQPPLFQYLKPIIEHCKALETEGYTSHLYYKHNSLFCIV